MQGSLGICANIAKWTPDEEALAKRLIAAYKQVQPTIVQGDLYRLISPLDGSEFSATQTVKSDKSQSVVFAFIHSTQEGRGFPILKLKGLDANAEYTLSSIEGKARAGTPEAASGSWWMNHGLEMNESFKGDFQAAAFPRPKKNVEQRTVVLLFLFPPRRVPVPYSLIPLFPWPGPLVPCSQFETKHPPARLPAVPTDPLSSASMPLGSPQSSPVLLIVGIKNDQHLCPQPLYRVLILALPLPVDIHDTQA